MGEITIGDFKERFRCSEVFEAAGWKKQLHALVNGQPVVALIHDSRFAWVFYREGDCCFIQQRLSLDGKFQDLSPRQTTTEEGEKVSEWSTTIEAISSFVRA